MGALVSVLTSILTGKAGEQIGGAVSKVAQIGALIAAIAPVALWLQANKEEVFIAITYGDLAFWGVLQSVFAIVVVRLVHRAPPPA